MYNNHVGFAIFVNPMFLLIFVFQLLFPPIIFQLANSLGNAVHGFALGYGDVLVGRTVLISPRREEQKMMGFTELQTSLGGMIDFRKTVLGNQNDGIALRKERRTTRVKTGLFSASHRHAGGKTMNNNRTYNRAGSS